MTITAEVNTITRQMTPFLSSTCIFSSTHRLFCISRPSKFNSMGCSLTSWRYNTCLYYVQVCEIHIYMSKMTLSSLLTQIFFFYITFANFWYITCFAPNLTPIWTRSHGLKLLEPWYEIS